LPSDLGSKHLQYLKERKNLCLYIDSEDPSYLAVIEKER